MEPGNENNRTGIDDSAKQSLTEQEKRLIRAFRIIPDLHKPAVINIVEKLAEMPSFTLS